MTGPLADRREAFRNRIERRDAMILPGAGNALTARVIADQGFDAVYVTGAGISNTLLGVPDIGLVTLSELAGTVSAIAEITDLPLVVDIDTGFGNAINAQRTVRMIERAGLNVKPFRLPPPGYFDSLTEQKPAYSLLGKFVQQAKKRQLDLGHIAEIELKIPRRYSSHIEHIDLNLIVLNDLGQFVVGHALAVHPRIVSADHMIEVTVIMHRRRFGPQ